jgi:hypothetical protein
MTQSRREDATHARVVREYDRSGEEVWAPQGCP